MKIYEVDVGVEYWVAAKNYREAIDTVWRCWEAESLLEEIEGEDGISFSVISEERARKMKVRDDELGGERSMWDFLRDQEEKGSAAVIACSEWP